MQLLEIILPPWLNNNNNNKDPGIATNVSDLCQSRMLAQFLATVKK